MFYTIAVAQFFFLIPFSLDDLSFFICDNTGN